MRYRWTMLLITAVTATFLAQEADARLRQRDPFENRVAISVLVGSGIPVGSFSDEGNHEAGGLDLEIDAEWYATGQLSLGVSLWGGIYNDKEFGDDLQTNLTSAGVFIRFTVPTAGEVYPYGKFGIGTTDLEFDLPGISYDADNAFGFTIAGGLIWKFHHSLSLLGQISYNRSFMEDSDVPALDAIVGFDVEYIAIDVGLGFYFF